MQSTRKNKTIPLNSIAESLDKGLAGIDAKRQQGIEGLNRMRRAKANILEREKLRLTSKLGPEHLRVMEIIQKIEVNRGLVRDLTIEVDRAGVEIPKADENTWILHGFVRDQNLKGFPNLTVALYDQRGKRIEQLAYSCTDKTGHFKLQYSHRTDEKRSVTISSVDRTKKGPQVFIHVFDRDGSQLCVDKQPLSLELGLVEYREIIIGDKGGICTPPDDTQRPMPGPQNDTPPDPTTSDERKEKGDNGIDVKAEAPGLEDIRGIGQSRAKKLRDAGIYDVRGFLEADDEALKEILGGIDVRKMKEENAGFLNRVR